MSQDTYKLKLPDLCGTIKFESVFNLFRGLLNDFFKASGFISNTESE